MPELSGIIEEVSSPPAMSAKAQAILATTRYVILPPGWSRVFYSHADDGLDLKKKGPSPQQQQKKVLGRGRGRPKKDQQQQQQQPSRKVKKAYSVYYVTSSGRVLLSAEEAMHFLHRADVACRCFLPTAGLAFNEVFSFEADIGTVALHSRNDLLLSEDAAAAVSSRCLDWCATFHGHLELEDRLRTTKRYMLHRETAHPLEAYSLAKLRATSSINNNNNNRSEEDDDDTLSNISAEFELTHEVAAMLTSSRRELLVTEEGQVYVRALTADHLKHLTYELWLAGVNTDLPSHSSRAVASNNDDQEEQEEEEFAAFFDGPVFGRRLGRAGRLREEVHSEGSSSSSHEVSSEKLLTGFTFVLLLDQTGSKDDDPSLVFLYNRPTTADPTPSKFDLGKQMAAASLSTDGTVAFFDETPSDEVTAYLQEKNVEELQAMRDFFKGGGSGLPQDELEEEEEEDQSDSSEEESISLSSEHSSDNEEISDDDDDDDDFLLSDVPEDGNSAMEESEEEEEEEEEVKTAKKVSTEEGRQSPAAAAAVAAYYDPDDLMTDDDSYEILPRFPPDPEDLMTEDEDEDEEDEGDNGEGDNGEGDNGEGDNGEGDEEHHEDRNQSLPPPDHLLPSASLVALVDIDPKRRLTRSLVTAGKVTVANAKEKKTAPTVAAAAAAPKQPKKRKKRKRIIPRDLYVRRPKPAPKKVPTSEGDAPSSDSPSLRTSKRNAATVAKESIRLTALNLY